MDGVGEDLEGEELAKEGELGGDDELVEKLLEVLKGVILLEGREQRKKFFPIT